MCVFDRHPSDLACRLHSEVLKADTHFFSFSGDTVLRHSIPGSAASPCGLCGQGPGWPACPERPGSPAAAESAVRLLQCGSCRGRFLYTDSQTKATVFSIHSCSQALFLIRFKLVFSPLMYILNSFSNFSVQNRIF